MPAILTIWYLSCNDCGLSAYVSRETFVLRKVIVVLVLSSHCSVCPPRMNHENLALRRHSESSCQSFNFHHQGILILHAPNQSAYSPCRSHSKPWRQLSRTSRHLWGYSLSCIHALLCTGFHTNSGYRPSPSQRLCLACHLGSST